MHLSVCQGTSNCVSCSLYSKNGGRCGGCTRDHADAMHPNFQSCYQQCHTCTGYKVNVTAVCCRSPLKDIYMGAVSKGAADWNHPAYTYKERPVLKFKQRAVFYISSGGVNTIAPGDKRLVDESHEVVAVNITRVWGSNGFYSRDLKDYLHLAPSTKLVLMTMCLDDLLERGWEKEMYADPQDIQRVGVDYWMPLSFSGYPKEAHMHQYYQTLRTLYVTEKMEAWWTTGDHNFPGINTDDLVQASAAKIPQMIFNMQFVNNDALLKYHLLFLKHYHKIIPAHVPFWLVGATTATFMHNVRLQCGTRDLYFLSAKPLYLASKGQQLALSGSSTKSKLPKWDLLQENYRIFAKTVKEYG